MKAAYIILEGKENATAFKQVFPTNEWGDDIEIGGIDDWSSAISLAGTIMSDRSRPVILIVNASSNDPDRIRESTQTIEFLLLPAANNEPYKVISAVPSIAALIKEIATAPDPKQHPLLQQINQFLVDSLMPVA